MRVAMARGAALRVVVIDDEPLALKDTLRCVREADAGAVVEGFCDMGSAVAWTRDHEVDVALLDIEMPGKSGLELAGELQALPPSLRVVFVTSFAGYALDAFSVHAQGYLLKPVDVRALAEELRIARASLAVPDMAGDTGDAPLLTCVTFGGFEAFVGETRLDFRRSRAKELMALLVDRRGVGLSMREIIATLWPDEPYDNSKRSYYQSMVASVRGVLREAGAEAVLVKSWNSLAVDPSLVDCDFYHLLDGDPAAVGSYRGDYLPQYEWAEATCAVIAGRR